MGSGIGRRDNGFVNHRSSVQIQPSAPGQKFTICRGSSMVERLLEEQGVVSSILTRGTKLAGVAQW